MKKMRNKFNKKTREIGNNLTKKIRDKYHYWFGDLLTEKVNFRKTFGLLTGFASVPFGVPLSFLRYGILKTNEDPAVCSSEVMEMFALPEIIKGYLSITKLFFGIGYDLGQRLDASFGDITPEIRERMKISAKIDYFSDIRNFMSKEEIIQEYGDRGLKKYKIHWEKMQNKYKFLQEK